LNIHSLIGENTWETILAYNLFTRKKDYYLVDLTGVEYTEIPSEQDTTNIDYFMLRSTFVGQPSSPKWRYRVGIDINHETLSGQRIENKSQAIGDYAVYGNIEFMPIPEITIQPGLRYAYNTSFDAPAVPSLLVKYRISNPWQIRLNVATGFRAPSVKELYLDFVDINHDIQGNTDLGPENSIHLSANVNYTRLNRGRLLRLRLMFISTISAIRLNWFRSVSPIHFSISMRILRARAHRAFLLNSDIPLDTGAFNPHSLLWNSQSA
jgi:outer membrane receptor for ferrienterochelin and colicins